MYVKGDSDPDLVAQALTNVLVVIVCFMSES